MKRSISLRPLLSKRVLHEQSRTEAFVREHFGEGINRVAVDLTLTDNPSVHQRAALIALLELCLRMDPVVREVRLHIPSEETEVEESIAEIALRFPLEQLKSSSDDRQTIGVGVGRTIGTYVDASDWRIGFSETTVPMSTATGPASVFAALEAAKYIFLRAVEAQPTWPIGRVFDLVSWNWSQSPRTYRVAPPSSLPPIALVGCGGVAAGYLWFLRSLHLQGELVLVDDDRIVWHNMNRLFFATVNDANLERRKVCSAAEYMRGWKVEALEKRAEHERAIDALERTRRAGGLIASAVGEPETRKFLARRGFEYFYDAATNSMGSAQVLALRPGISSCAECHLRVRPIARPEGCGAIITRKFAGVVPHLAAYAGALMALEQLRPLLVSAPALSGANTQSVLRSIEPQGRESTLPCSDCPFLR